MSTTSVDSSWIDGDLLDVKSRLRNFSSREAAPLEEKFQAQGVPDRQLYARAGELGLCDMSIPEEYGASSLGLSVSEGIVAHYLLACASEEQKLRRLPKLCSGEWVGAIAMTEPGTGSDLQAVTTGAVREGEDCLATGSRTFITNAQPCDLVVIVAKTDATQGAKGISLLVAEVGDGTPGFTRGRNLDKIGLKGQDTSELFFDNLRVPAANILGGKEGRGFHQLMNQLPQERLVTAIVAQAISESAVAAALGYTKELIARSLEKHPLKTPPSQ